MTSRIIQKTSVLIRYLRHHEIDVSKWDNCIRKSFNGLIYADSWYLDLVNSRWEALVEGDYERVMPLTPGRKLGIDYLFQPAFTQQLGIFSTTHLNRQVVSDFLKAIPAKYRFAEINLNTHNKLDENTLDYTPWITHELDLIGDYESIAENYATNLKRNLKKAAQSGLTITENVKPELVIEIFRKNKGKHLSNLKDQHYDLLRRLIYVLIYKQKAVTVGAYDETNSLCGGAFFVQNYKKVIFFFSATDETAKATGAMPLIIDHFIQRNARSHLTLDFEGSNDPNLARFYKSFGAVEITYPHLRINRLNPLIKAGLALVKKIRG